MEQRTNTQIDECLASWQQGDVVFSSEYPFIYLADLREPLTERAQELAREMEEGDLAVVSTETIGFAVLSQTCDIVRSSKTRPYVEISPIVQLTENESVLGQRGRLSRYVFLPAIQTGQYFVDLDRIMTVEKGVIAGLGAQRQRGVRSEQDVRGFAEALGRRKSRAAFPDDFVASVGKFQQFLIKGHEKNNAVGAFLRSVKEIRVLPKPSWNAEVIEVDFLFVFDTENSIPTSSDTIIESLLQKVTLSESLALVEGRAVGLNSLSAATYLESDRLELDHLSNGSKIL